MAFLSRPPRRLAHTLRFLAALCLAPCVAAPPRAAAALGTRETEIKVAALVSIISFTEWPATEFASADAPLVIGVLGRGPIATLLADFVADETWHGRRIVVRPCGGPADSNGCHVLFLARSDRDRWPALRAQFAPRPLLTISDGGNFARQGGIVQLDIESNRLRLTVNLGAAQRCGLIISSKVLRLAQVIDDRTP